ncbi:uncharacterized protein [Solanum lycopersicum]|uniref:uncharacterized protein n=1 Tax=Solanum lycopersicum TaxID=4081 RepID=UPI0037486188
MQVKKSKIDNLNRQYEPFRMVEGETIQDMHTRFTSIINEMYSLGEIVPNGKAVRKLLSVLPKTWESKVEAITKARDLDSLAMDELIGNLITYELKKNQEKEIGGKRKERNLVLKATTSDDFEDENIALITKRFTRMPKRGQAFQKKTPQKPSENTKDLVCHKCGSPDHFIKFCPLWALEQKKANFEKGKNIKKHKFVPSNKRMTTQEADISMKKAFAGMGNSSDEESEGDETENKSFLALEQEDDYDFLALVVVETKEEKEICGSQETILALMAGSDSEEDEEEEDMNEKGSVTRKQQQWYLDSACSRHMTGDKSSFLSLKNIKGGNVAFGNGKSDEIQGIGKVGPMDTHAIENIYYVNGLQHNLLSVSQICDKGNNVLFTEKECRVTNSVTGNLVLLEKIQQRNSCIRSDHGLEFENSQFLQFCTTNGIEHNFSAPRTPQQNGVVERKNRTLEDIARTICMIRSVLNKTPYELIKGKKPNLAHLRAFWCVCFIHNNDKDNLGKFDAKSDEGIFLGYSSQSKAYNVLNKRTNRVEESVHVVFNENSSEVEGNSEDEQNEETCSKPSEPKIWGE